ncbi:hypothetical protein DMB90_14430 [Raoultella planticola]|uniref:Uncharacterized protein n=1 Tax=Raoultella planticola TaxID=575 RepID=A0A5P6AB88_RAOPL|nr:hypothetical protein DMB90_14430 [Raoultella planticola]
MYAATRGREHRPYRVYAVSKTRLALRLAGLRAHSSLCDGSPGKAFTPPPGDDSIARTEHTL